MTQRCPHDYCTYNSLFVSVLYSLGRYISQIPARSKSDTDKLYSKDYIHMNECISESNCVCELIVKLWDVVKKYMLELFSF